MFLFQYHEDSLRLLEEERGRDERGRRLLRELSELRSAGSTSLEPAALPAVPARRTTTYTGPERRMVPCPEMKEAMTP